MNAVGQAVAAASAAPLQVRGLTHRYAAKVVLDRVDLALQPGSVLGLIGRNGAGKSHPDPRDAGLAGTASGRSFRVRRARAETLRRRQGTAGLCATAARRAGVADRRADVRLFVALLSALGSSLRQGHYAALEDRSGQGDGEAVTGRTPARRPGARAGAATGTAGAGRTRVRAGSGRAPRIAARDRAARGRGWRHGVVFDAHRFRPGTRGVGHRVPA